MATVALLCSDLLFGSNVEGALRAAGHDVSREAAGADVAVVDLDEYDPQTVAAARRVGFYPHVNQDLRRRAVEAGFDVVVPRSRMARETAAVVEGALTLRR